MQFLLIDLLKTEPDDFDFGLIVCLPKYSNL